MVSERDDASGRSPMHQESGELRPFAPPGPGPEPSLAPSKDPSVLHEPWMRPGMIQPLPTESPLIAPELEPELAQHSVWDEPGATLGLAGALPEDALTWYRFYCSQVERTSTATTWWTTFIVAACSGLCAVLGALIVTPNGWATVVLAAPLVEEILKIGIAIWVVEKKPWLFRYPLQILLCGATAGLVFAVLENFLYLKWYVPNPSYELVVWRWTVCVALHTSCSLVAAWGASRIWRQFQREHRPPQLSDGTTLFVLAIAIHGVYNLLAVILQVSLAWF